MREVNHLVKIITNSKEKLQLVDAFDFENESFTDEQGIKVNCVTYSEMELFSEWLEKLFYKLGHNIFKNGLPLGFVNSKGFNEHFDRKADKVLFKTLYMLEGIGERDIPLEATSSRLKDLRTSLWLLSQTHCYVSTTPMSSSGEEVFTSQPVTTQVGTLNQGLLDSYGVSMTTRQSNALNRMIEGMADSVSQGELPFPVLEYNKHTLKFPRNKVSFLDSEYMVLPVSLVNGYADALRGAMRDNVVIINARKTAGELREFTLTSNEATVLKVYNDNEVLEYFTSLRSPFTRAEFSDPRVPFYYGLHNLNFHFFEMGISKEDYPSRQMNITRIKDVELVPVSDEEQVASLVRRLKRYISMDVDLVISQVKELTADWSIEEKQSFINDTLNDMKSSVGAVQNSQVIIKSNLDFQMKFSKTVERYSTSYIRAIYDYMLKNSDKFDGFHGNNVDAKAIVASMVQDNSMKELSLDDEELEF